MKRILALSTALSLAALSLGAAPVAASQPLPMAAIAAGAAVAQPVVPSAMLSAATVKKKPAKPATARIKVGKTKTTVTKKPVRVVKKIKLPVLTGSTARNRSLFSKSVKALFTAEYKVMKAWNPKCTRDRTFTATPRYPAIHKKRYASVVMDFWTGDGCGNWGDGMGNLRTLTMDLKTGKKVSLSTFVDQDDFTTKIATHKSFKKARNCVLRTGATAYGGYDGKLIPRPSAWSLSAKGLRVWYSASKLGGSACGKTNTVLPWAEIATKKAMSGKIHTRTYTAKAGYGTEFLMISTQGRKVAIMAGVYPDAGYECSIGIRSGKNAAMSSTIMPSWSNFKLADTSANPKPARSMLQRGLKPASSKQVAGIRSFMTGTSAISNCK